MRTRPGFRPGRLAPRAAGLAAAVLVAAQAAPAARLAVPHDWIPLSEGNRWSYRVSKERVFHMPDGASRSVSFSGADVEEVTRSLGRFAGARAAFEVRFRSRHTDPAGEEETRTETMVVSASTGPVVMHTGTVDGRAVQILRPITLLPPAPTPGMEWDGGRMVTDGMSMDVRGRVVGFEDLRTPAGEFTRCLKVHSVASLGGSVEVAPGTRLPLNGARYESTEWYAAGVGMVREDSFFAMTMILPDGGEIRGEETTRRVLDAFHVSGAPGTAPAAPQR